MKKIIAALLLMCATSLFGEASMGQAKPDSGDIFLLQSPTNGQVSMRDVVLRGMAGKSFSSVSAENTSLSNSLITVPVKDGRWSMVLPLAVSRSNIIIVKAIYAGQDVTRTPKVIQVRVQSRLDLTTGGVVFMGLAWLIIILLNIFAFVKIFGIKEEKIVEPLEIDTQD